MADRISADSETQFRAPERGAESYMGRYTQLFFITRIWSRRPENQHRLSPMFFVLVPSYLLCFYLTYLELIHVWGDLNTFTEALDMSITFAVTFHKFLSLTLKERQWKRLVDVVEQNFYRPEQRDDAEQSHLVESGQPRVRILVYSWTGIAFTVLTGLSIAPAGQRFIVWVSGSEPALTNASVTNSGATPYMNRMPMRTWTPFDGMSGFTYWAAWAYHCVNGFLMIATVSGYDMLLVALMDYATGQLRVVQAKLTNIRRTARDRVAKQDGGATAAQAHPLLQLPRLDEEEENSSTSREEDLEMRNTIAECVEHHEIILRFVDDVEELSSKIFLSQFFCSSIILCTTGFKLATGDKEVLKLMSMAGFLVAAVSEIGLSALSEESLNIGYAAYSSEWYYCSIPLRRSLSLIMYRASKVSRLTFGRFSDVSLETFAAILRTSYSYFTILNDMNEDNTD